MGFLPFTGLIFIYCTFFSSKLMNITTIVVTLNSFGRTEIPRKSMSGSESYSLELNNVTFELERLSQPISGCKRKCSG